MVNECVLPVTEPPECRGGRSANQLRASAICPAAAVLRGARQPPDIEHRLRCDAGLERASTSAS